MKRLALLALAAVLALSGCVGEGVRHTEDWLADQQFVTDVQVVDSTADDMSYRATIRAELDPSVSNGDLVKLIDDTVAYVATQPGDDVKVQFGIDDIDFAVDATAPDSLFVWHGVLEVEGITSGLVTADSIWVRTPSASAITVYQALIPYDQNLVVDGILGDGVERASLIRAADCDAGSPLLGLVEVLLSITQLTSAELDMCEGFDATFAHDFALAEAVTALRADLDGAGFSEFPVRLSTRPELDTSADFHFVSVTPGDPAALAVVAGLEGSAVAMRYDLDGARTLLIESDTLLARDLLSALGGNDAAALLAAITLQGSDTTVTGTIAELPLLLGAQN